MSRLSSNLFFAGLCFTAICMPGKLKADSTAKFPDGKSHKVIVQYTGDELQPASLVLPKLDSSVFFLNKTVSTPVEVRIDFRGKKLHCHSKNIEMTSDGYLQTKRPIEPLDFVVLCFPIAGSYPFSVTEVGSTGKVVTGEVRVDE